MVSEISLLLLHVAILSELLNSTAGQICYHCVYCNDVQDNENLLTCNSNGQGCFKLIWKMKESGNVIVERSCLNDKRSKEIEYKRFIADHLEVHNCDHRDLCNTASTPGITFLTLLLSTTIICICTANM